MSIKSNNSSNYQSNDKKQVATLFMHGYGGTNNSEKYMVNQAVKSVTKDVVTAYVLSNGEVQFSGKISKKSKNPIIKILFEDNKNGDIMQNAQNIKMYLQK